MCTWELIIQKNKKLIQLTKKKNLPCSLLQKKYSVVASSEADTFLYLPRICRLKLKKKKKKTFNRRHRSSYDQETRRFGLNSPFTKTLTKLGECPE